MPRQLTEVFHTPAKVNIGLVLLGQRADGFHDLHSLIFPVTLLDEFRLGVSSHDEFDILPQVCETADNLVVRAVHAYRLATDWPPGVACHLRKSIPVQAGLGGGSSDCALVLRWLNQRCPRPLSDSNLLKLALSLGSDVPFFLYPVASEVLGRGERIRPILRETPRMPLLILKPPSGVSTAKAFSWLAQHELNRGNPLKCDSIIDCLVSGQLADLQTLAPNVFETAFTHLCPDLPDYKQILTDTGAGFVSLSGSGSSWFAIYPSSEARDRARSTLPQDWEIIPCDLVQNFTVVA